LTKRWQLTLGPTRLAPRWPFGHRPSLSGVLPCVLRQAPSRQKPRAGPQPNGSGSVGQCRQGCRRSNDPPGRQLVVVTVTVVLLSTRDGAPPVAHAAGGVPCPDRTALGSCRRRSWARPSAQPPLRGTRWRWPPERAVGCASLSARPGGSAEGGGASLEEYLNWWGDAGLELVTAVTTVKTIVNVAGTTTSCSCSRRPASATTRRRRSPASTST